MSPFWHEVFTIAWVLSVLALGVTGLLGATTLIAVVMGWLKIVPERKPTNADPPPNPQTSTPKDK